MNTITIPKHLSNQGDLIVLPRKEYEALLELKKAIEFTPTAAQKKALKQAEKNFKAGKSLSFEELCGKLGFEN